jgi:hypothetical protein
LANNPGTGVLGGTLVATASNGQAVFGNLHLNTAGSGYTLSATSGTLTPVTTTPINVSPAAASALFVSIPPPTTMTSGALFGLQISAMDPYGNLATGFNDPVMIALDSNPGGGSLIGGPTTVNATAGIANFTAGITTQTPASGYTLKATSPNLTPVTTGPITVVAAVATKLTVVTQPSSVAAGAKFTLVIGALDQFNNPTTNFNGTVTVAVASGSSTLGGTTSVATVNGQATFNNLTLTASSSPVTLTVTGTGLPSIMTQPITVTGLAQIAFSASAVTVKQTDGNATITVVRASGYSGPVSVNVATSGGTAVAGVNYTSISTVLNFGAGQNSQTVTIPIKNAGTLRSPLTFNVVLSAPGTNVALGSPSTETVTIQSSGGVSVPLVTMGSVTTKKNSKGKVTGIVIGLSGAVNKAEAQATTTYELIVAGAGGSFTGKGTKRVKINSAVYNSANNSVKLSTAAFGLGKNVELVVLGGGANGLQDAEGRYIDGNHDGVAGGNAVAVIKKSGVTINAAARPRGPLALKHQRSRR